MPAFLRALRRGRRDIAAHVRHPRRGAFLFVLFFATLAPFSAGAESGTTAQRASEQTLAALADVVEAFSVELGVQVDATPALRAGRLDERVAAGMAATLGALLTCHRITSSALPETRQLWRQGALFAESEAPSTSGWAADFRACGTTASSRLGQLGAALDALGPAAMQSNAVDLWPILRFEPEGGDDVYVHDYVLLVDAAGDDGYFNNAGGNGIDVKRGPAGSGAPFEAPARGCQTAREALIGQECVLTAAALVDSTGEDVYGRLEAPDVDAACTADPVVRRILIQGAGAVGVGLLLDAQGDDTYTGKVITTGAGHINGFGHLRERGGNDSYLVIRIGEGAATVGGNGSLVDSGGHDTFDFYIPSPLDPNAPNLTPGAGGVLDDQGRCDRGARLTLGAGNLGGVGLLDNAGGDDSYRSSERGQGFGSGGFGTFRDSGGGRDTYAGAPGRGNNVTILPSADNQGFFQDS
jgi:hypothetical protein